MARQTPTQVIQGTAARVVESGDQIKDPIERALAYEQAREAVKAITAALAEGRADAIREARKTRTLPQLEAELGITRARIYQIMDATPPVP